MSTQEEGVPMPTPPSASQKNKKQRLTINQEMKKLLSEYYPSLTYEDVTSYGFRLELLNNVQESDGVKLTHAEKAEVQRQTVAKRQQVS